MRPNLWEMGARRVVGPQGVRVVEVGLRAFEATEREQDHGPGGGFEAVVARARAAAAGLREDGRWA